LLDHICENVTMYTDTVVPLLKLMASIGGDNVVVFYYLCSLEIWLDKRDNLWCEVDYCTWVSE